MNERTKTYREIKKFNRSVIHNFDLSIVMPFYKRMKFFLSILPHNAPYLQRNGIEVILVMDEPGEQSELLSFVKDYPFINWKIIVNEAEHEPRNPAPVLNVGIRHATKRYVMVCSPETSYYTDIIFQLRNLLENYPDHYAIGQVAFVQEGDVVTKENEGQLWFLNYGSIMVERRHLEAIGGYDEHFKDWGGEDDNLRKRLDMLGIKKLLVPEAKALHYEKIVQLAARLDKTRSFSTDVLRSIFYPDTIMPNTPDWGTSFGKLIYNWQDNQYAEELCRNYLSGFIDYEIKDSSIFKERYKKLILCQAYNESEFMPGFLEDMANYFDGIILLDDESTDTTWELACHDKILMKVKKKRECFNDLENRNILLNLASFFKSEWFCFMDIDERFDERYVDFAAFENNPNVDAVAFLHVDLWDSEELYYANSPFSKNGISSKMRMFRSKGHMQIIAKQEKLHFSATPIWTNVIESKILFKHFGKLTSEMRQKKYEFYLKEDVSKDQSDYSYLLNHVVLMPVSEIRI